MNQETIAAIATPPGQGAIAVIRISGPDTLPIAQKIFSKPLEGEKGHTVHFGHLLKEDGSILDSVLLLLFRAPRSYTGEDLIEISCHGGEIITRKVLERVLKAGAKAAQPGEFSLRAYLNQKIDLAQAEAIQELIGAKNDEALNCAERQLEGALSEKIKSFQKDLIHISAILEAWVDFPEEDLEFAPFEEVIYKLEETKKEMTALKESFHEGQALFQGFSICLIGAPNVGKSSLMNVLLGKERAIVTSIAGTTRDALQEDFCLGAYQLKLIDTAGIRSTEEVVEQEGIRRSEKHLESADLILLVLDASRSLQTEDLNLLKKAPKEKRIVIWNKTDIQVPDPSVMGIAVSAKEKKGLHLLKEAIDEFFSKGRASSKEEVLITKLRHYQALDLAILSLDRVIEGLKKEVSAELVVSDLKEALKELGKIIGIDVTEEILTAIFSTFCLGK